MGRYAMSPEEFVALWQGWKGDVASLAKELGVTVSAVNSRACYYRKHGIPMKRLKPKRGPGRPTMNIAELKRISKQSLFNSRDG